MIGTCRQFTIKLKSPVITINVNNRLTTIASHRWRKRDLALIPTKFGLSYTALLMNQAGALIHIYQDGSVLVSHGGVEMGQGLHTKMLQIAAEALEVSLDNGNCGYV